MMGTSTLISRKSTQVVVLKCHELMAQLKRMASPCHLIIQNGKDRDWTGP